MKRLALLLLIVPLAGCASQTAPAAVTAVEPMAQVPTIYVSRHMRKGEGDDPSLSAAGAEEAVRLATLLKDRGIAAIFVTPTKRSRETAQPLATATGAPIET